MNKKEIISLTMDIEIIAEERGLTWDADTIESIIEQIESERENNPNYDAQDWENDTEANFPEFFNN